MLNQAITIAFYAILACSVVFGLLNLLLSNIYDVKQSGLRRRRAKHPHARHLRQRPLVSVIVYAHNNSQSVEECLSSLATSSYKKLEIIVVSNVSSDDTNSLVRKFSKNNPKLPIRLIAKKKFDSRESAIKQAAAYTKGNHILILDAYSYVEKGAIKLAVISMLDTKAGIITLNSQADHEYTLSGLSDSIKSVILNRVKKAGTLITPGLDPANHASLYTKASYSRLAEQNGQAFNNLNSLHRMSDLRMVYESQSVVRVHKHVAASKSFTASTKPLVRITHVVRNLLSRLEPIIIIFMVYVSLRFDNPGYLLLAWATFTVLFILAVWSDDNQKLSGKLGFTILSFIAYGLYIARQAQVFLHPSHKIWNAKH